MKSLKLSFVLILLALAWSLSAASLLANGVQSQNAQNKTEVNVPPVPKPASSAKQTAHDQRGTEKQPLFIQVIKPSQNDSEAAQIQKERDEKLNLDRRTVDLNSEMVKFTEILAVIAFLNLLILAGQVWFNRALAVQQRVVERAYIMASESQFVRRDTGYDFDIHFENVGETPARIGDVRTCWIILPIEQRLPETPDYSLNLMEPVDPPRRGFLHRNADLTIPGRFRHSPDEHRGIRDRRTYFCVYGYVDYMDQFNARHRAGFAWTYFEGLGQLTVVGNDAYTYDRPRRKGVGRDWD